MPNRHPSLSDPRTRGKHHAKLHSGRVSHDKVRLRMCAHAAAQSRAAEEQHSFQCNIIRVLSQRHMKNPAWPPFLRIARALSGAAAQFESNDSIKRPTLLPIASNSIIQFAVDVEKVVDLDHDQGLTRRQGTRW